MATPAPLRYFIFGGENTRERAGGMRDFMRSYEDRWQARAYADGYISGSGCVSWALVYDNETGREDYLIEGR